MKRNSTQSGFTLIEVMVSVAIFSIIVTIGIGSLLSVNTAHKKALANKTALDSVNFVMESIAKSIRTGDYYTCGDLGTDYDGAPGYFITSPAETFGCGISNEGDFIQFNDSERGKRVSYKFDSNNKSIIRSIDSGSDDRITGNDVFVDKFQVVIVGNALNDRLQPRATIRVVFRVLAGSQEEIIEMQTTVSQRSLDAMPMQSQNAVQQAQNQNQSLILNPGNNSQSTLITSQNSSGGLSTQISTPVGPSPINGAVKNL